MILKRILAAWLKDALAATPERVERLPRFNRLVRGRHGLFIANENDVYVGRSLIHYGEFSELEWAMLRRLCEPGAVVVEAGANIGAHTVSLAQAVGADGRVIAIEPQPEIFRALCANLALNGLGNVSAHNCGCGEQPQVLHIPDYDYAQEGNFGGIGLKGHDPARASIPVEVKRLDDLLTSSDKVSLIKVDVEGMEAEAVRGAAGLLQACRPAIYIENDRPQKSKELIELIGGLGYRMWWHTPPLFNPDNFFGNRQNLYPGTVSINMLCLHRANPSTIADGLAEVGDASSHPLLNPAARLP